MFFTRTYCRASPPYTNHLRYNMKDARRRYVNSGPSSGTKARAETSDVDPAYIALDNSDQEEQGAYSLPNEEVRGKKRKMVEEDVDYNSEIGRLDNVPKKPRLDPGSCRTFIDIIEDVQLQVESHRVHERHGCSTFYTRL